ncbi:hypothetical protein RHMOL_Rhmol04G0307400 [Rhododendron molle]|uniref:Uncharacterized protein n=1 Tax=Rhododendron molle TaxID=49168 RepID=A0ACC0P636_RHOML|nr:hypothetical protein RHMOL_Rhmol04G0307400 [Rhododendron molle]
MLLGSEDSDMEFVCRGEVDLMFLPDWDERFGNSSISSIWILLKNRGKVWPVHVIHNQLGDGWPEFWDSHKLRSGFKVVFGCERSWIFDVVVLMHNLEPVRNYKWSTTAHELQESSLMPYVVEEFGTPITEVFTTGGEKSTTEKGSIGHRFWVDKVNAGLKTRRKLQLLPISDEENSVDKGSPARFSGLVDSEPSNVKCNIQLPVEHGVQISQENKESDKAEISLQSKSTEMVITSVQNAALQSCITNVNIGDTSLSQPTVSAEVVEKLIEPNADVSMTDTLNAEATVAQEEILDENQEIQSNADFEHQYTSMSSRDKDAVQSVVSGGKNTVDMQDKGFLSQPDDNTVNNLETKKWGAIRGNVKP